MDEEDERLVRRAELKHYLTEEELTLPDAEREVLLVQRKLVDQGLLNEMDLIANRDAINDLARKNLSSIAGASKQEKFETKNRTNGRKIMWALCLFGVGYLMYKVVELIFGSSL